MKKRIFALLGVLLLTALTSILAVKLGVNPPAANIAGGYAAILLGAAVAALLKVSDGMYYLLLVFIYLAEPIGSVMNLYRSFAPYDKIIHFLSGILIAAVAGMIIWKIFDRNRVAPAQRGKLLIPAILFSVAAAGAGAGIWEIIEFTIDILVSGGMQRGMEDTITDMIAGNLGGLLYGTVIYFKYRRPKAPWNL